MLTAEVPAGPIEYEDTGGDGPTLVLLHGLFMSGTTWRKTVPGLRDRYRCITPTLPLGAHRRPMHPDADLTLLGQANLVADFLAALDLRDVTLVSIDWGGGLFLPAAGRDDRVARYVICPSEAFDNFPPGISGRLAVLAARMPGGTQLGLRQLRISWLRKLPMMFGQLFKRDVPDEIVREWTAPALESAEVRRDVRKYLRAVPPKADLVAWTEKLADFAGPTLILWAPDGTMMPPAHGPRLADLIPDSRYFEISDAYTMVNEDQPELFVRHVREFLADTDVPRPVDRST